MPTCGSRVGARETPVFSDSEEEDHYDEEDDEDSYDEDYADSDSETLLNQLVHG